MVTMMPSNTDLDQEKAFRELPGTIDKLQSGDLILTKSSLLTLYHVVRNATRGKPPKTMRSPGKELLVLDEDTLKSKHDILEELRNPCDLTRGTIISYFKVLQVHVRRQAPSRTSA